MYSSLFAFVVVIVVRSFVECVSCRKVTNCRLEIGDESNETAVTRKREHFTLAKRKGELEREKSSHILVSARVSNEKRRKKKV